MGGKLQIACGAQSLQAERSSNGRSPDRSNTDFLYKHWPISQRGGQLIAGQIEAQPIPQPPGRLTAVERSWSPGTAGWGGVASARSALVRYRINVWTRGISAALSSGSCNTGRQRNSGVSFPAAVPLMPSISRHQRRRAGLKLHARWQTNELNFGLSETMNTNRCRPSGSPNGSGIHNLR